MIEKQWLRGRVVYVNGVEVERLGSALIVDRAAEHDAVMAIMREAWAKLVS